MNPNNTEQGRLAALRRLQNQYDRDAEEKAKKQKVVRQKVFFLHINHNSLTFFRESDVRFLCID